MCFYVGNVLYFSSHLQLWGLSPNLWYPDPRSEGHYILKDRLDDRNPDNTHHFAIRSSEPQVAHLN